VILGIDKSTGLPKLAIELPPEDAEREDREKRTMSGTEKGLRAKSVDRDTKKVGSEEKLFMYFLM